MSGSVTLGSRCGTRCREPSGWTRYPSNEPAAGVPHPDHFLMPTPCRVAAERLFRSAQRLLLLTAAAAGLLVAQGDVIRTATAWRTLRTAHFDVHYVREAEAWALDLAPRLDAIRDSVAALVGYRPDVRVTIVIDDPYNTSNGMAIPLLDHPTIVLWATPPGPTDVIGNHRGWALKLAAHEFGHIAHLTRPARRSTLLWHLLPAPLSPITAFTPRWATEGYATWIEGKITGTGRPHGVWRPAILRELALEGRLPSYAAMSGSGGYKGGSMAYLAGSAFWEWLAAQRGDTSMTLVFRRQTARTARSFDEAFRGVYGDTPGALYGRFTTELTVRAATVDSLLRRSGLVTGIRLARFTGAVGGIAATRDAARIALALPGLRGGPPRVMVTVPDTQRVTEEERTALTRAQQRDPQDVPAVRLIPRLAKPVATLTSRRGRTFGAPRFIDAAGSRLLLESWSWRPDGSRRPDLAIWDVTTNAVRYVTDGASVQDADPSPDGTRAAAVRCTGGVCDLVVVSLTDGSVRPLVRGSPVTTFAHPRWSPDGTRIAVSVQDRDGLWRLGVLDATTAALTIVSPDDGIDRHTATFDVTGTELVHVSEAGGILDAATLRLSDGVITPRTRVTGSVYEPLPTPDGGLLYLAEFAGGMDLYRLGPGALVGGDAIGDAAPRLAPALPRPRVAGVTLAPTPVAPPVRYVAGPRTTRLLLQGTHAREGSFVAASISNIDPANRLALLLTGMAGGDGAWRGGVASAAWYGSRPHLRAESFWLEQPATRQRSAALIAASDSRLAGASVSAELPITGSNGGARFQASGFLGSVQLRGAAVTMRALLSGQASGTAVLGWHTAMGGSLRVAAGRSADSSVARASAGAFASLWRTRLDLRLHRASRETPRFEQFTAGGFAPPLSDDATLAQRIPIPALPVGIATGARLTELRLSRPAPALDATLYAHAVGTDWQLRQHSVVLGIERGLALDYLGITGLPRFRVSGGVARIVRGPLRNRSSLYLSAAWRP